VDVDAGPATPLAAGRHGGPALWPAPRAQGCASPLPVAVALALLALGCVSRGAEGRARAYRIAERTQRIGGPAAVAEVGDWVLENDVLRVAILQEGNSVGPGMFGGSLVDADLVRHDGRHPPGEGLDALAELVPMVNLMVPGYRDDPGQRSVYTALAVERLADGSQEGCPVEGGADGCAAIRAAGKGDRLVEALGMIEQLQVRMNLSFETVYLLDPGADYVRVRTDFYVDNRYREGNEPLALPSVRRLVEEGLGVLDVLVGDALLPATEPHVWQPGFLAGDFLLLGKKLAAFVPGHGFDFGNTFQRLFDEGRDILGDPQVADAVVGVGHGVSYAYAALDGPTIVPIYTGEFTGVFTHGMRCAEADEGCTSRQQRPLRYTRLLAVGRGDVASAMAPVYRLRGTSVGTLSGHVYDPRTGGPLSGAQVFLVTDPWAGEAAPEVPRTAETLFDENRARGGTPGVATELGTDLVGDAEPDGSFAGPVPAGTWFAVVRAPGRGLSMPVRVRVAAGAGTRVSLAAGVPGSVRFEVFDETGSPSPAKLTFVGPIGAHDPCGEGARIAHLTAQSDARPLPLGGGEVPGRVAALAWTVDGFGEAEIEPGRYDLWISRGFEYSVDRRCIDVPAYEPLRVVGRLRREVDTSGWVSGDFHVHGAASYDGELAPEARIRTAIAEGVEVLAITDHDVLTDLGRTVDELGLRHRIAAANGAEVTPIETGHVVGFPLWYDERLPEHGAIDWTRRDACLREPGLADCNHEETEGLVLALRPGEVFDLLRSLGQFSYDDTLVIAPHPRDGFFGLFDQFGLNHWTLAFDPPGLVRGEHTLLRPENFDWNFDALELFNAKRFEMIRTPSAGEIADFAHDLQALREAGATEREISDLHLHYARRVLARSQAEEMALRFGETPECFDDEDCAGAPGAPTCDPQRRRCIPPAASCTGDASCAAGEVCSYGIAPARCVPACASDRDCPVDERCDESGERWRCVPRTCAATEAPDAPCARGGSPERAGPIDDWFRLLNHGVVKTGLGNSDSHALTAVEAGSPRNWIAVGTDDPGRIDLRQVVRSIRSGRVIASYGPFVELFVDGKPVGSTVELAGGGNSATVEIRVQAPSWFDVDRVELYRNGELIREYFVPLGNPRALKFYDSFADTFDLPRRLDGTAGDVWYVAIAMGVDVDETDDAVPRDLSPVYLANRHPYLGFSQVVSTTFASIDDPLLHAVLVAPLPVPEQVPVLPYAVTNPVFVDANGEPGWQAPLGPPPAAWAGD
jgi:hypothetical protein